MRDVLIIGGGPGGLESARLLAADGWDVGLVEEHQSSGDPVHCTGVVATEVFDELGLTRDVILNPLTTVRFIAPSGATIEHTTAHTEAVVVDRVALDRHLHDRARAAGVAIELSSRAAAVVADARGVTVRLSDGRDARARMCVLACGAQYAIQRRLGMGLPAAYLQSAQMELPASRLGDVEVRFGARLARGGFAWTVPVARSRGPHVRIGLMCDGDARRRFRSLVQEVGPWWGIAPADARALVPRQKVLPLAPITRTFADRVIAVGDAAGLVKATTGGGVYYSLLSAVLAASVIAPALRADRLGAAALAPYEAAWRARLGPELDAQLQLRRLGQRLTDTEIDAFFDLARTDGILPIVRQTARFNQHRHLILSLLRHPPSRRILLGRLGRRAMAADALRASGDPSGH